MYKVLIIDDEEPLREAIRILGDWEGLGVDEILEATNGLMGLDMLKEHSIDLAIVDMKMPELGGTELLKIIEQQYPDLLTIVISGYNDFEYTRQAIHSKVIDYLLKPVNRHDLNEVLQKAMSILSAKRKMKDESINKDITLNMSLPKLKEKVYLSIIERSHMSQMNDTLLPIIGASDPANRFTTVVLRVLNLTQISGSRFHHDIGLLHYAIGNVIDEIAGNHFQCFSFPNPKEEREMIAVITMKGGYREDMVFRSLHQMKRTSTMLYELLGIVVLIGIGKLCNDIMDIASSYDSAKTAINDIDLIKLKGTMVTSASAHISTIDNHPMSSRIPMIRSALESGNNQYAKSVVNEFVKQWTSAEAFSIGEADRAIHEFIFQLNDIALGLKVSSQRLPMNGVHGLRGLGISNDFTTFQQFEALLTQILEFYIEEIRKSESGNRMFEVGDIKQYIDEHYFEDIKISLFTDKYYLSREYLMKLFKQQYGFGIHEYVQKVRMGKAKELLGDSTLKIQDISEMLGYKDKNYFSKAFRNYYSVSPTEYRDSFSDEQ